MSDDTKPLTVIGRLVYGLIPGLAVAPGAVDAHATVLLSDVAADAAKQDGFVMELPNHIDAPIATRRIPATGAIPAIAATTRAAQAATAHLPATQHPPPTLRPTPSPAPKPASAPSSPSLPLSSQPPSTLPSARGAAPSAAVCTMADGMIMAMRVQVELKARLLYDGYMTDVTKAAIRRFQLSRRLPETGTMDSATLAALGVSC